MAKVIPDGRDQLDQLADNLVGMFSRAEQELTRALAVQVSAGLESNPNDVARELRLRELREEAERQQRRIALSLDDEVASAMRAAAEGGRAMAASELMQARPVGASLLGADEGGGLRARPFAMRGILGSAPAAVAVQAELTSTLTDVSKRILRFPDDAYRRAVTQSASDMLLGVGRATQRSAQAAAWQRLVSQGVTGFTDKLGRRWKLSSYVETATRTAVRRAWDVQHETTLTASGIELVTIAVGSGACKPCSDQAGKIFRLDNGPTGRVKVDSTVSLDQVTVNIAGTLDDARSHGWRHPNCRCRPVAYLPGLPPVADVTTYDPQKEADRAKLRSLERDVRASKASAAAAVTPEQRARANARTRELQGQIRTHVDETGLMRQRYREQLDLGNRPGSAPPVAPPAPAPVPVRPPSRPYDLNRDVHASRRGGVGDIDELVRSGELTREDVSIYVGKARELLKRAVDQGGPLIELEEKALSGILRNKRMKSLYEFAASKKGAAYLEARQDYEHGIMGIPRGTDPKQMPIYGYGYTPHGSAGYGELTVKLKDDVLDRTTWTVGDSLNNRGRPLWTNEISSASDTEIVQTRSVSEGTMTYEIPGEKFDILTRISYVEAQVHGGVGVGDIAEVVFPSRPEADPALVAKLLQLGIKVTYREAP